MSVPTPSTSTSAPAATTRTNSASGVVVNRKRQQGNPLISYVRVVRYEWGDCAADIQVDGCVGIVYLALSYHKLHSQYIHTRLAGKGENAYSTRVLLVVDNVSDSRHALRELSLLAFRLGWTLIVTRGVEEAAEYVESLKLAESKDIPFGGKKRLPLGMAQSNDERGQLADQAIRLVTGARGVTKSDAKRILSAFGSLSKLSSTTEKDLSLCAGIGPVRAPNLIAYMNTPFYS